MLNICFMPFFYNNKNNDLTLLSIHHTFSHTQNVACCQPTSISRPSSAWNCDNIKTKIHFRLFTHNSCSRKSFLLHLLYTASKKFETLHNHSCHLHSPSDFSFFTQHCRLLWFLLLKFLHCLLWYTLITLLHFSL